MIVYLLSKSCLNSGVKLKLTASINCEDFVMSFLCLKNDSNFYTNVGDFGLSGILHLMIDLESELSMIFS